MEETVAVEVVEKLRARSVFAHVNRRAGVYNVGVRVVIPDGREAIWDNDGAAGLEAMVLRDGILVGFVPQIPDSDELDADAIVAIIAATDYDAPVDADPPSPPAAAPQQPAPAPSAAARPAAPPPPAPAAKRWTDRIRRRG
ncbi:MAG TPA: hypothetical protein VME70_11465 [Mycobacteriales bacterium]|nr:hypothetical protein [Mycobacteriales bacterium]